MLLAARRLIYVAIACAVVVALIALLVYGSSRISHYDAVVTSHLLAAPGSGAESIGQHAADGGNFGPTALVLLVVIFLGAVWGRPWHLLAAGGLVLFANASTQIMKLVLAHPRLQGALGVSYPIEITYPSGHTTAALSAGFALWLVSPPRWRGWALLFALAFGSAVGLGVIIAGWHFISDVIGAVFVVGFWLALVLAALVVARLETPADWLPQPPSAAEPER